MLTPQVFEFLSNLDPLLPSFSLDNWRSTIRHCANEHPKYSDLAPFVGNETSDIVYDDASGVLTALLIHKEHLSNGLWEGKTPRYYIEVKSTLSRCETPFYVSQGQAERVSLLNRSSLTGHKGLAKLLTLSSDDSNHQRSVREQ